MINWSVQLTYCSILVLFTLGMLWRYDRRVARARRTEALQYKLFAIRDKAIRMVARGSVREDDEQWQRLYAFINEGTRATTLDVIRRASSAFAFTRALLDNVQAPQADRETFNKLPGDFKRLWAEAASTIIDACFGSPIFRWAFRLSLTMGVVKSLSRRVQPALYARFAEWKRVSDSWDLGCPAHS